MRPLEFYRLGIAAASNAVSEPVQRMVVNRLYYGLHHEACCRFFRENPMSGPLNRSRRHTDLRDRFNSLSNPESRNVSRHLNDLMMLRTEADYRLASPLRYRNRPFSVQQLFHQALESARQLLDALEEFSPGEAEDGCNCPQAYTVR